MLATLGLGVAVMGVNAMEERMIANTKDRDLALQAAEAALRDAEQDVASNVSPATAFTDTCAGGLCTPPSQRDALGALASLPVDDARLGFDWTVDANVRSYGQYTGAAPFPSVAAAAALRDREVQLPRHAGRARASSSAPSRSRPASAIASRRARVGARPETVVVLQSIYATR